MPQEAAAPENAVRHSVPRHRDSDRTATVPKRCIAVAIASHVAELLWAIVDRVRHSAGIGCRVTRQPPSTPASTTVDADLDVVRKELAAKLADADLMAKLHRAVEAIARVPFGSIIAQDLVADAIGDTYEGKLAWDPRDPKFKDPASSFQAHVVDEARLQFRRAARARQNLVSLDALADQDARLAEQTADQAPEPRHDPAVQRERIRRARQILASRGDMIALQLLTLRELGVTRRRELRRMGLSGWKCRAAYDRLREVFATLDAMPTPEVEHPPEHVVSRVVSPDGAITELTGGHRLGPKRADDPPSRNSAGGFGAPIAASRRRSRKR